MRRVEKKWLECFKQQRGVFTPYRGKTHLVYAGNRDIMRYWEYAWDRNSAPQEGDIRSLCGNASWWERDIDRHISPWNSRNRDVAWSLDATNCGHCKKKLEKIMYLNGEAHKLIVWEV